MFTEQFSLCCFRGFGPKYCRSYTNCLYTERLSDRRQEGKASLLERWLPPRLCVNQKASSYLLIAKTCKQCRHLAAPAHIIPINYSKKYFRLCKSRAADKTQTALGTMEQFYEWHLDNKNTCTGWPCWSRGGMTLEGFKPTEAEFVWDVDDKEFCCLCALPGFTAETLSAVKPVCTWQHEVCWSKVIWWRGASAGWCWRSGK